MTGPRRVNMPHASVGCRQHCRQHALATLMMKAHALSHVQEQAAAQAAQDKDLVSAPTAGGGNEVCVAVPEFESLCRTVQVSVSVSH
eukprot:3083082-Rhodomonas_salina.2